jgi:hypothetical protein
MKRIVVIAGTAALAAGVGVGAAAAYADPSPSPSPSSSESASPGRPPGIAVPGMPGMPGHVRVGGPPAFGQMLHGEAVTKDDSGAVKTHDWQTGVVTAVSGSSVTVRSDDGTAWTWTLNGDTRVRENGKQGAAADVKAGDKVAISGLRSGDTRTAAAVLDPPPDLTKMRDRMRDLRKQLPHLRQDLKGDLPSPPA